MPKNTITYNLLISSPGDVPKAYLDEIVRAADNINSSWGKSSNILIQCKHWSKDSYPASGEKPQEILNKQFVEDCDLAIAIFWRRFGTPTDKYGSGTEEEIAKMIEAGKQVLLYFLNTPNPSDKIDAKQYKKVCEFQEKYKNRGYYFSIDDIADFKNKIMTHLLHTFTDIHMNSNKGSLPSLQIKYYENSSSTEYSTYKLSFVDDFIKNQRGSLVKKIEDMQSKSLPYYNTDTSLTQTVFPTSIFNNPLSTPCSIKQEYKDVINEFALEENINIEGSFYNVGSLQKTANISIYGGSSLNGTDEEKERYTSLINLYLDIKKYSEYAEYFNYLSSLYFARFFITNMGDAADEDIDVKLIVPKDCIFLPSDSLPPSENIIKEILDFNFLDKIFLIKETSTIEEYSGFRNIFTPSVTSYIPPPFYTKDSAEEYEDAKERYFGALNNIFAYKVFSDDGIIKFNIPELKHNISMAFPAVLIFRNNPPAEISYEISSKRSPLLIKGALKLKQ
ncbi:hypothetical protein Dip518_001408 [Parelusimicrobium proximum]|uniref:hypothetical protein n=1 Tax=Parelusimicrobium proximum TaxID=3228953 RepID=UPI003D1821B4